MDDAFTWINRFIEGARVIWNDEDSMKSLEMIDYLHARVVR